MAQPRPRPSSKRREQLAREDAALLHLLSSGPLRWTEVPIGAASAAATRLVEQGKATLGRDSSGVLTLTVSTTKDTTTSGNDANARAEQG